MLFLLATIHVVLSDAGSPLPEVKYSHHINFLTNEFFKPRGKASQRTSMLHRLITQPRGLLPLGDDYHLTVKCSDGRHSVAVPTKVGIQGELPGYSRGVSLSLASEKTPTQMLPAHLRANGSRNHFQLLYNLLSVTPSDLSGSESATNILN